MSGINGHLGLLFANAVPTDPYFANRVALLHLDGANNSTTITDVKGKSWSVGGNAVISTAQSRFGGASAVFDGNGDFVTCAANTDFNFGTGQFMVQFSVRPTTAKDQSLFEMRPNLTNGAYVYIGLTAAGALKLYVNTADRILTSNGVVAQNVWSDISLVRDASNVTTLYVGTTSVGTWADTTNYLQGPVLLGINNHNVLSESFAGYIDECRITKGISHAITALTAPFPNS